MGKRRKTPANNFCRKSKHHEVMEPLLVARASGEQVEYARLLRGIEVDGRRRFLAGVNPLGFFFYVQIHPEGGRRKAAYLSLLEYTPAGEREAGVCHLPVYVCAPG